MGEYLEKVPEHIREHIRSITATSGLPESEESVEQIAEAWLEKSSAFESKMDQLDMEEWDEYAKEEEQGALIMTYSGSLVTLGPLNGESRSADYTSIGLRQDVPESASYEDSGLAEDVQVNAPVVFERGPLNKTSPVYKIAVMKEQLEPEEESRRLREATQVLSKEFADANKTIVTD